jgi:hypothetical protein
MRSYFGRQHRARRAIVTERLLRDVVSSIIVRHAVSRGGVMVNVAVSKPLIKPPRV